MILVHVPCALPCLVVEMKGVGPAVLEKPLEDDARFEQLPTAVTSEEFLDFSGSASVTAASLLYSVQ